MLGVLPGAEGEVDQLSASCDGHMLGVWALRGHTLDHMTREASEGSHWSPATRVTASADRLGAVDPRHPYGPVVWRAPTLGGSDERDDLWRFDHGREGDALAPAGVVGVGFPSTFERRVIAGFARQGEAPFIARVEVPLGLRRPSEARPERVMVGELLAVDHAGDVLLTRVVTESGPALVFRFDDGSTSRVQLDNAMVNVHPRGVSVGGRSVFLVGEMHASPDGGGCVDLGPGRCIVPGEVSLLVAAHGRPVQRWPLDEHALPDGLAVDHGAALALWVRPVVGSDTTFERAARVEIPSGRVHTLTLTAPPGVEALDNAALTTCGDTAWITFPSRRAPGDGGGAAVMALPWSCVAR